MGETGKEARTYPERIWAGHLGGGRRIWKPELAHEDEKAFACEYVRADALESLMEENARLRKALEEARIQIEYLHSRLGIKISGHGTLAVIDAALSPDSNENVLP